MHLAQHHFQQQSRYFEEATSFALSLLHPDPYGFVAFELDADALADGRVALSHARGVMPDGTAFSIPEDPPPAPLVIGDRFGPTEDRRLVSLAIPPFRPGDTNCALDGAGADGEPRFRVGEEELPDETTGSDVKTVKLARKNFRLILEGDGPEMEDWIRMPLARVRRDGAGSFARDTGFIPPVLQIGASPSLLSSLRRLIETMRSRADTVAVGTRSGGADGPGRSAYGPGELTHYWMLHALHSALPLLNHHLAERTTHPERLFRDLSRLAGALCTFSMDSDPADLPGYDHDDLEECFGTLEEHVRGHLDVVLPTAAVTIELSATRESFYEGRVRDPRLIQDGHWFLGVRAPEGAATLSERVPRLIKVCSAKHIARLVQSAHPALPLTHRPSPPAELAPELGTEYFRVEKEGPCWKSIQDTSEVGVYLPDSLSGVDLELKVVRHE